MQSERIILPRQKPKRADAAVIVAHPDDETLWAGGFILEHPEYNWFVLSLCRASDPDRAPRFYRVLEQLNALGAMADMDDGPTQEPLDSLEVQNTILEMLPQTKFDLLFTHGPQGEYTRHQRHVEVCEAVLTLWRESRLKTRELCLFAYEDGGRRYLPRAVSYAHRHKMLPQQVWQTKYRLMTQVYGFGMDSWEAQTTPRAEAFWRFESQSQLEMWLAHEG
jgi:LmbE family N-acetylglucosaminyl deacetylase